MSKSPKGSLYPVLFGVATAITFVLVATIWPQSTIPLSYGTGTGQHGGAGGSGGLLVCPPTCPDADVDLEEAIEAGDATMAEAANQTTTNVNTTEFLAV
jgi:hypothetical protein